jgi:hypothetical protein
MELMTEWDSAVGIVTGYELNNQGSKLEFQ